MIAAQRRLEHELLPAGGDGVRVDADVVAYVKADVGRVEHGVDRLGADEVAPPRMHDGAAVEEHVALGVRRDHMDLTGAVADGADLHQVGQRQGIRISL